MTNLPFGYKIQDSETLETIFYNRVLTESERGEVFQYFIKKYGINIEVERRGWWTRVKERWTGHRTITLKFIKNQPNLGLNTLNRL